MDFIQHILPNYTYLNTFIYKTCYLCVHLSSSYYFGSINATLEDYLNPKQFDRLATPIRDVRDIIKNSSNPDLPYWLGETADASGEGTPNVSDRFASSFL